MLQGQSRSSVSVFLGCQLLQNVVSHHRSSAKGKRNIILKKNMQNLQEKKVLPLSSSKHIKESSESSAFAKMLRSVSGGVCSHCFLFSVMSSGRITWSSEEQQGSQGTKA